MQSHVNVIVVCLWALAVLPMPSCAENATTTTSSTTTTTEAVDYNLVTCFSDAGCMMPMRGPPYCQNNAVVRDVKYGACENSGTEGSRCVQKTNVTIISECTEGQRCQGNKCVSDEAQSPPDTVAEVSTTETTTTLKAETGQISSTTSTTSIPPTSSTAQPMNQTEAVQPQNTAPSLVLAFLFVVLAFLILAAIATTVLICYFVYKRKANAPQEKRSAIFSNGKKSALNVKYLR